MNWWSPGGEAIYQTKNNDLKTEAQETMALLPLLEGKQVELFFSKQGIPWILVEGDPQEQQIYELDSHGGLVLKATLSLQEAEEEDLSSAHPEEEFVWKGNVNRDVLPARSTRSLSFSVPMHRVLLV